METYMGMVTQPWVGNKHNPYFSSFTDMGIGMHMCEAGSKASGTKRS